MKPTESLPGMPPRERGTWRAFALAAFFHLLLLALFLYGMRWQNSTPVGAEAEMWTETPDLAPPRQRSMPTPPPAPVPAPAPAPQVAAPPKVDEAEIAVQEARRRLEQQKQAQRLADEQRQAQLRQAQQEQQNAARRKQQEDERTARAAQLKADQLAQRKLDEQRALEKEKEKAEQAKAQQLQQLADQKRRAKEKDEAARKQAEQQDETRQKQAAQDAARAKAAQEARAKAEAKATEARAKAAAAAESRAQAEQVRRARLAALQGMAGDNPSAAQGGGSTGSGSGAGGHGSPGYADKVRRRVKPNVVFDAGSVAGNPQAVVAVTCAPDGALLSAHIARSSGNADWDEAVLRAVQKSDPMPRDSDGQTPHSFTITFRPRD